MVVVFFTKEKKKKELREKSGQVVREEEVGTKTRAPPADCSGKMHTYLYPTVSAAQERNFHAPMGSRWARERERRKNHRYLAQVVSFDSSWPTRTLVSKPLGVCVSFTFSKKNSLVLQSTENNCRIHLRPYRHRAIPKVFFCSSFRGSEQGFYFTAPVCGNAEISPHF